MRYKRQCTLRLQFVVNPACSVENGKQIHLDQSKLRQNPGSSVKNGKQIPLDQSLFTKIAGNCLWISKNSCHIQPFRSKIAGNFPWISQNSGKIQSVRSKMANKSHWISHNSHSRRWQVTVDLCLYAHVYPAPHTECSPRKMRAAAVQVKLDLWSRCVRLNLCDCAFFMMYFKKLYYCATFPMIFKIEWLCYLYNDF